MIITCYCSTCKKVIEARVYYGEHGTAIYIEPNQCECALSTLNTVERIIKGWQNNAKIPMPPWLRNILLSAASVTDEGYGVALMSIINDSDDDIPF